jgi:16S rRNA processing protein RimM
VRQGSAKSPDPSRLASLAPQDEGRRAKDRLVALGVITGAHGIKGEVVLRSYTAEPEAITRYGPLQTTNGETIEVVRLRPRKDGFIAALKHVTDRNRAEELRGSELFIARDKLPAPANDEVYLEDLIGLDAVTASGAALGKIIRVANFGAGDLIELEIPGLKDTVLVPFVPSYVPEVDIENGRAVIDLPDGYLASE